MLLDLWVLRISMKLNTHSEPHDFFCKRIWCFITEQCTTLYRFCQGFLQVYFVIKLEDFPHKTCQKLMVLKMFWHTKPQVLRPEHRQNFKFWKYKASLGCTVYTSFLYLMCPKNVIILRNLNVFIVRKYF